MKKIYPTITLLFLLFPIQQQLSGQNLIDQLSNELCQCLEKKEVKNADAIAPCFEDVLINNLAELKKYYKVASIEEINVEEMGGKIGAKLIKECNYVIKTFPIGIEGNEDKVEKQPDLVCNDVKQGDFYYLTKRPEGAMVDTTFVTISNNLFLERMKNGRTFSLLNIEWKDNCSFDLIFKESNDPLKKEISKPGDVYTYEILTNTNNSVYLKTTWLNKSFQFKLIKIK